MLNLQYQYFFIIFEIMKFEWDENKNLINIKKHGIDFNQAKEIFKDKYRIEVPDERKDYGEVRIKDWIKKEKIDINLLVKQLIRNSYETVKNIQTNLKN